MADVQPSYHDNVEKKKQFGIELAKRNNQFNAAFEAGCAVFGADTNAALWVSREWIGDIVCLEAREEHLKTVDAKETLLDKDTFAAKLLELAEAKNLTGTHYLIEDRERVALLKLYAEVQGFIGNKVDPTTIINNNSHVTALKLILVKPSNNNEEPALVENAPNQNAQMDINSLPVRIKLVK